MTAIILFLKNYRQIIICAIGLIIAAVFLAMYLMIGHYKGQIVKLKIANQKAQIELARQNAEAIVKMNEGLQRNAIQTGKLTKQIKSLKIEGKCIQDENYYNTAADIIKRYNDSLH